MERYEVEVDLDLLSGKTKFFPMPQEILDVGSAQLQNMEKRRRSTAAEKTGSSHQKQWSQMLL